MKKRPLTLEGKLGIYLIIAAWVLAVGSGGLSGLFAMLLAVGGFYILTHQDKVKVPLVSRRSS